MLPAAHLQCQPETSGNRSKNSSHDKHLENFAGTNIWKTDDPELHFTAEQAEAWLSSPATTLSDMDAEISALDARLAKARQLKQGMAQALLTGRIRLV